MMDMENYKALSAAQDKAEDVRAMFGGVNAVLGAADDYIYHQLMQNPLEGGHKDLLTYHGSHLQDLLSVIKHLLLEMEDVQSELVHQLGEKTFAAWNELEAATATVSGAKDG